MVLTIVFALGLPLWLLVEEVMRDRTGAGADAPAPHAASKAAAGVALSRAGA